MEIKNLADAYEAIRNMGYSVSLREEAVVAKVGEFPVVVTINSKDEVVIHCQIAKLGDVQEEKATQFAFAALDANSRLSPFALSIITEADDETLESEADYPIVLIDNIPLGDLSEEELSKAFQSLHSAIISTKDVLVAGLPDKKACCCQVCE